MINTKKRGKYIKEEHIAEEALEQIWTSEEEYGKAKKELLYEKLGKENTDNILCELTENKLVKIRDSVITLTKTGQDKARQVIRRHRLAERLLHDVLEASDEVFERGACQFEHFINEDIATSICTLLGHPAVCPHGKLIPPGKCCVHTKQKLQSVFGPLSRLRAGVKVEVIYITSTSPTSLDFLSSVGIVPGLKFTIHHRKPSLVIQFGEAQLALDDDLAKNIFVRVIAG